MWRERGKEARGMMMITFKLLLAEWSSSSLINIGFLLESSAEDNNIIFIAYVFVFSIEHYPCQVSARHTYHKHCMQFNVILCDYDT